MYFALFSLERAQEVDKENNGMKGGGKEEDFAETINATKGADKWVLGKETQRSSRERDAALGGDGVKYGGVGGLWNSVVAHRLS